MAQICSNEQKRRRFSEREQVYTTIWIVPNSHTWQYYVLMNFRTCPPETCKHNKFDCILPQYGYASQLGTQKNCIAWFIIFRQTHATNWRMTPFWDKFTRTAFNTRNVVPLYCLVNRDSQFMDYDTIPSNQTWQWKIPYKWKFLAGKTIYKWRFFQQATW